MTAARTSAPRASRSACVCPACVEVRIMQDAERIASAEMAGVSAVFVEGGGRRQERSTAMAV